MSEINGRLSFHKAFNLESSNSGLVDCCEISALHSNVKEASYSWKKYHYYFAPCIRGAIAGLDPLFYKHRSK